MAEMQIQIIRGEQTDGQTDYVDFLPKNLVAVAKNVRGADSYLISHDGLKLFGNFTQTIGLEKDRGGIYNERQGRHVRVINNSLVNVMADGSIVKLYDIPGINQCSFDYSFVSTLIMANGQAWRLLDDASVAPYTDPDFTMAIDGVSINGFYVFTDGEYLFHTDATNEASINPSSYATAKLSPDPTIGLMRTQDGLLLSMDRFSMQYFYFTGGDGFAFAELPQKTINAGIVGTKAKTMLLGDIFILGGRKEESPSLYIVGSGDVKSISTRTVDKIIAEYEAFELEQVVLESRMDERTAFLIVRLPRHTLCFNYTFAQSAGLENAWTVLSTGVSNERWVGCNGVYDPMARKWIYGSINSGKLYELDKINGAHDGQAAEYEFQTPIVPAPSARVSKVEINTVTGYSVAPQSVFISISNDMIGFETEWVKALPSRGNYGGRYIVNRLGFVPDEITFKVRALSLGKINFSGMIAYGF
jgi:hypothetical protein